MHEHGNYSKLEKGRASCSLSRRRSHAVHLSLKWLQTECQFHGVTDVCVVDSSMEEVTERSNCVDTHIFPPVGGFQEGNKSLLLKVGICNVSKAAKISTKPVHLGSGPIRVPHGCQWHAIECLQMK